MLIDRPRDYSNGPVAGVVWWAGDADVRLVAVLRRVAVAAVCLASDNYGVNVPTLKMTFKNPHLVV